jgi:chromosome segregation ATPase
MVEKVRNEARKRRQPLRDAASSLERAIAAAAGTGAQWRSRLQAQVQEVRDALEDHVTEVERPGGLVEQITTDAPRLMHIMNRLLAEHDDMRQELNRILQAIGEISADFSEEQVIEARIAVMSLLATIARHRQQGADLLYEAYNVDIGGE